MLCAPDTLALEKLRSLAALVPTLARMCQTEAADLLEELRHRLRLRAGDLAALKTDLNQARKEGKRRRKGAEPATSEPQY